MTQKFEIKKATRADIPLILSFIKALAEYEKLAHEVEASEEILAETLFGAKQHAEVIIGYLNEIPVSFALFFHNFSTFLGRPGLYLEDLYVIPEARQQGIGLKMLSHLALIAQERKCGRLEWWVLDWNKSAIAFYERLGAKPMSDWTVYRLDQTAMANLATLNIT